MSLYILDTDILSLYQRDHPDVKARVEALAPTDVAITVISVEEQLSGWYAMIRKARTPEQLAQAYERLANSVSKLSRLSILTFSEAAIQRYENLAARRLGVPKMDLRIAAIVLESGGTLATRNVRDFSRVPGLPLENWVP